MFARIKRVGAYASLQAVRTERQHGRPRQRVLATLGRVESLQARGELDGLLHRLSQYSPQALALLCGQTEPETRTWKLGPTLVFARLWQRLGLGESLEGLLAARQFGFAVERAVFVTVLHRLCVSGSDRQAERWREGYWLPGTEELALHHWYRAMAWLGQALPPDQQQRATPFGPRCVKDQVEEALFARRRDLFSGLSVVYFDTTSLYFEGQGGQKRSLAAFSGRRHATEAERNRILPLPSTGEGRGRGEATHALEAWNPLQASPSPQLRIRGAFAFPPLTLCPSLR